MQNLLQRRVASRLLNSGSILRCQLHTSEKLSINLSISTRCNGKLIRQNIYSDGYLCRPSRLTSCGFHTSQSHNVHPIIWLVVKPVLKISAALTGRGVRKMYRGLDHQDKRRFWKYVRSRWDVIAGVVAGLISLFATYYMTHLQVAPVTGRKRFVALTHDQINLIAESQAKAILEQYQDKLFPSDSEESKIVMDVARRLHQANPELQKMNFKLWQVFVVDDPTVNACVLPNGCVFVYKGMLEMANTPDRLAIILGHEMAHALLEHGIEELSYSQLVDYAIIVLMAAIWCVIPSDGIAFVTNWFHNKLVYMLTHLPHSRAMEEEADKVGAMLAAKACYDIRQGSVLWQKIEGIEQISDKESIPTFLSTHPHNLKRAEFFDFIIPQAEKWRDEMKCPLWPQNDPREAIPILSKLVDDLVVAKKSGQNLRHVRVVGTTPGHRKATASEIVMPEFGTGSGYDKQAVEEVVSTKSENEGRIDRKDETGNENCDSVGAPSTTSNTENSKSNVTTTKTAVAEDS